MRPRAQVRQVTGPTIGTEGDSRKLRLDLNFYPG